MARLSNIPLQKIHLDLRLLIGRPPINQNRANRFLGEHLLIVEYFTTWCTQCPKTVAWLEELEQKYEHAIFLRVSCVHYTYYTQPSHQITTPIGYLCVVEKIAKFDHLNLERFHHSWTEQFQVGKTYFSLKFCIMITLQSFLEFFPTSMDSIQLKSFQVQTF